jgi:hypothetical protein
VSGSCGMARNAALGHHVTQRDHHHHHHLGNASEHVRKPPCSLAGPYGTLPAPDDASGSCGMAKITVTGCHVIQRDQQPLYLRHATEPVRSVSKCLAHPYGISSTQTDGPSVPHSNGRIVPAYCCKDASLHLWDPDRAPRTSSTGTHCIYSTKSTADNSPEAPNSTGTTPATPHLASPN